MIASSHQPACFELPCGRLGETMRLYLQFEAAPPSDATPAQVTGVSLASRIKCSDGRWRSQETDVADGTRRSECAENRGQGMSRKGCHAERGYSDRPGRQPLYSCLLDRGIDVDEAHLMALPLVVEFDPALLAEVDA